MKPGSDAVNYASTEMNMGGLVVRMIQLIPAAPSTYVLVGNSEADCREIPVVAWGIWDAFLEDEVETPHRHRRNSGPVVFYCGCLWPADVYFQEQYLGVRIGQWQSIGDGETKWHESVNEPSLRLRRQHD